MQAERYDTTPLTTSNLSNPSQGSSKRRLSLRSALTHTIAAAAGALAMLAQPLASTATLTNSAQALGNTGAPTQSQFFAATGKAVSGDFLTSFQRYGLERIGYPLSDERVEGGQTVQYFERVRMERHPDLAAKGYGVLFTRLGVDLNGSDKFAKVAPFTSTQSKAYVSQTGHSLAEPFLSYWKNNGSVEFFGYPIAEPMNQDGLYVQWFERARMEYHPELAKSGQGVQLTLLGRNALGGNAPQVQQPAPVQKQTVADAGVQLNGMESALLKAINDQRAAAGLRQVTLDAGVADLSRARSADMAQRNYFSHTTPEGTKFLDMLTDHKIGYKFAGEILARNNYPEGEAAQVAMDSYLGSPAHKAVIFDSRYTSVGLGYALSSEDEMNYFTVIFIEQ